MKISDGRSEAREHVSRLRIHALRIWKILARLPHNRTVNRFTNAVRMLPPWRRQETQAVSAALTRQISGDFAGALELWQAVRSRWPGNNVAYASIASCARALWQFDLADEAATEGMRRFPRNRGIIAEAAQNRQVRGDWPGALALWEKVVKGGSAEISCLYSYCYALLLSGEYDRLEKELKHYRALYPNRSAFLSLEAMLAGEREDWETAVKLWQSFREAFPDEPVGWEHYGRAHQELEYARMAARGERGDVMPMEQAKVEVVEDAELRQLFLGFEGIGSDCEFGLVQRRFGAEPLSLLRFNNVTFGSLMTGLAHRFEGMGLHENTEIIALGNGEYFIRDRRWGLGMHTFKFVGQVDPDLLYRKFCERVVFLREKLLTDLGEGRKIFVFFSPGLAIGDLKMLHGALKELGPVKLLHVTTVEAARNAGRAAESGGIERLEADLHIGYLSRVGARPSGGWNIAFDDWLSICRQVRAAADG